MDDLKSKINVGAAIARGALSQMPVLGPIVNEIVGQIIPDRRIERLTGLVQRIEQRVAALEPTTVRDRFSEPVYVDLLEDAFFQAARASSPERLDYIAEIVSRGITQADAAKIDRQYLLRLLGELNDTEVLRLCLHGKYDAHAHREFYQQHSEALEVPDIFFNDDDTGKHTKAAIRTNYSDHLEQVGLLARRHHGRRGQIPEFEDDGTIKGSYLELSSFGFAFLREIGQPSDIHKQQK